MSIDRVSSLKTAHGAWGENIPDWVIVLAEQSDRLGSQTRVAKKIGYSPATVSLVMKNQYTGNLENVELQVRGELMKQTVSCPVFPDITVTQCRDYRTGKQMRTGSIGARLKRACRNCIHNTEKKDAE